MTPESYWKVADWLSQYAEKTTGERITPDPVWITEAVTNLIDTGTFTQEELRREALRETGVMIPEQFFLRER